MKLAITADLHLKTRQQTPDRYQAFENILQQISRRGIKHLIIAGDLFDKDFPNYSEFDMVCREFSQIEITVIPGNHDSPIDNNFFSSSNIDVITIPKIKDFDKLKALFIPFNPTKSIDEAITEYAHKQKLPERWILIAHGDYITRQRELNIYEPEFYMPLTNKSILKFNPIKVFLGHIHKPSEFGRVFYPGSPCGLDVTETGKRSFLIYNSESDNVEKVFVKTEKIYFNESILIPPVDDIERFLEAKIGEMKESWGLSEDEISSVVMRLSLKGYIKDLKETERTILRIFQSLGVKFYEKNGLDFSEIKVIREADDDRLFILQKLESKIEELRLNTLYTSKEKILSKVMDFIFNPKR